MASRIFLSSTMMMSPLFRSPILIGSSVGLLVGAGTAYFYNTKNNNRGGLSSYPILNDSGAAGGNYNSMLGTNNRQYMTTTSSSSSSGTSTSTDTLIQQQQQQHATTTKTGLQRYLNYQHLTLGSMTGLASGYLIGKLSKVLVVLLVTGFLTTQFLVSRGIRVPGASYVGGGVVEWGKGKVTWENVVSQPSFKGSFVAAFVVAALYA